MSEDVRPVPFAPGYFVSADGVVLSERRGVRRKMRPWVSNRSGHLRVTLRVEGSTVKEYVHRLVALVFIGPPPTAEHEVRHLDGKPVNNDKGNLTWGTHTENMQDMVRHGTQGARRHPEAVRRADRHWSRLKPDRVVRGQRQGLSVLTEEKVRAVLDMLKTGEKPGRIAAVMGVCRTSIRNIRDGKTWTHVGLGGING